MFKSNKTGNLAFSICMKLLRILLLALVAFASAAPLCAQKRQKVQNLPYVDQRRLHYGFLVGVNFSNVNFVHKGNDWFASVPSLSPCFEVGLLGDMALSQHVTLRSTPTLYFMQRDITFRNALSGKETVQDLKSTYMELPVTMKVATRRLVNYRPYIAFGVSAWYDWTHEEETPVVFGRFDASFHVAMGCDFYLPFFKFCPELRFNFGLLDMIDHDRKGLKDPAMMQYTDAIRSARNNSVSLVFYFE